MSHQVKHLLLVDDEPLLRQAIAELLTDRGFQVQEADSGEAALSRLAGFAFDALVTDLRLPGVPGTTVIEAALERYPDIVVVVVTGYGTVKDAVEAIKRGAADFVAKPFQIDELMHALMSAFEQRRLRAENAYLRAELAARHRFDGIVGVSRPITKLRQLLENVSASSSTILITGETGTGKEVVARAIHHNSARRDQPFVALNCSAIPDSLLEAELFGHVRGAFTGAIGNRMGRVEQAHRGTLFLDEVGTMSLGLQAKLLRVLQEREFERVGDTTTVKVDVRIVAATNSDLQQMVRSGGFREDLFYRLNVIPVHVPPLRERRDDIPLLVQHFMSRFAPPAQTDGQPPVLVSQDVMRRLMAYHWPGNVRQLENTVERAVALRADPAQITVDDLLPEMTRSPQLPPVSALALPDEGLDLDLFLADVERELILRSLERTGGNKGQAARLLHLKRTTLVEKLKRLDRSPVGRR
jgi:DNA-binding NtrC family response regulator